MMITISVNTFAEWRAQARQLLAQNQDPRMILWNYTDSAQITLFDEAPLFDAPITNQFLIPKQFLSLAKIISYHRDPTKWDKLYQLLWRLTHGERHLLSISSDELVHQLLTMAKAIKRDAHKMKAFVRFCKYYEEDGTDFYLAWYKPDHLITKLVAPFFQRRFEVMRWTIITPDETIHWNGEQLHYSEGKNLLTNPSDELENLWQTYYKAIFNPARIKIKAMKKEMPMRHWHNLPETKMISSLLKEAPTRVNDMLQHQEGSKNSASEYLPKEIDSIETLKENAKRCQGCSLYKQATQTVFGFGNTNANLILVGEQPGHQEDLQGIPFIGPAGQVLRKILEQLDILQEIYITNAVKHFKYAVKDGQRIHSSPGIREIIACKPWVQAEIEQIQPRVVLCLGLTAAKSLINPAFRIKHERGQFKQNDSYIIGATYHPSAILRAINPQIKESMLNDLANDLKRAYLLSNQN